jgi:hypothetical protein
MLGAGAAAASAGPRVFPIPGFVARQIQLSAVRRLDDGGALLAGSLNGSPRSPDWRPAVVRLFVDGSVDLAYGNEGISRLHLGASARATALAINPQTGGAWVGLSGSGGAGQIVSLDGSGRRQTGFGLHGIAAPPNGGEPEALGWQPGELLVASGTQPCAECGLAVLNPSTGALLDRVTANPEGGCLGGPVTSAVAVSPRTAAIALGGRGGCPAEVIPVTLPGPGGHGSLRTGTAMPLGSAASTAMIAATGSAVCLAGSSPGGTIFGPFVAGQTFAPSRGPAGRLVSVGALGRDACAALVTGRGSGGVVVQASGGRGQPTRDAIPASVQPLGMFRCHAHLLVIGTRPRNGWRAGAVVVIPVRRGPSAGAATTAVAGRCH